MKRELQKEKEKKKQKAYQSIIMTIIKKRPTTVYFVTITKANIGLPVYNDDPHPKKDKEKTEFQSLLLERPLGKINEAGL